MTFLRALILGAVLLPACGSCSESKERDPDRDPTTIGTTSRPFTTHWDGGRRSKGFGKHHVNDGGAPNEGDGGP